MHVKWLVDYLYLSSFFSLVQNLNPKEYSEKNLKHLLASSSLQTFFSFKACFCICTMRIQCVFCRVDAAEIWFTTNVSNTEVGLG
jgi:hypothetical protein